MTYFFQYWIEPQTGRLLTADGREGVSLCTLCTMEVGGALRHQSRPLPPAPFPGVTLTLETVTTVIKIDWNQMRRGLLGPRRPPDLRAAPSQPQNAP